MIDVSLRFCRGKRNFSPSGTSSVGSGVLGSDRNFDNLSSAAASLARIADNEFKTCVIVVRCLECELFNFFFGSYSFNVRICFQLIRSKLTTCRLLGCCFRFCATHFVWMQKWKMQNETCTLALLTSEWKARKTTHAAAMPSREKSRAKEPNEMAVQTLLRSYMCQ